MKEKDTTLAMILSFIVPGLGQAYVGKTGRGVVIFIVTFLGYLCFIVPGFFIWLWNIFDARDKAKEFNSKSK